MSLFLSVWERTAWEIQILSQKKNQEFQLFLNKKDNLSKMITFLDRKIPMITEEVYQCAYIFYGNRRFVQVQALQPVFPIVQVCCLGML